MRLLVVSGSPPLSSLTRSPKVRIAPQPPGPGLPEQAPSVWMTTCGSLIRRSRSRARSWWPCGSAACGNIPSGPSASPARPAARRTSRRAASTGSAAPPAADGERIGARGLEVETGQMQLCEGFAERGAMHGGRPADPQAIEKRDDRGRTAGHLAEHISRLVLDRLRAGDAAAVEVLHQG